MLNWFTKKQSSQGLSLRVDIHSHLLPGIDDGVQTFEQAEEIVLHFQKLGYSKLITSPHVMSDSYRNTTEGILEKLTALRLHLKNKGIAIEIESAAEYYLDDYLIKMVEENKPLLTFGKNYLLFETNFLTEPFNLKEFIFLAITKGYKPVLAHPERYLYLQNNTEKMQDFLDRGILFQVNINSISGYYSKEIKTTAHKIIDKGWVHFLGSDCHTIQQAKLVGDAMQIKYFQKALSLPLLNHTL